MASITCILFSINSTKGSYSWLFANFNFVYFTREDGSKEKSFVDISLHHSISCWIFNTIICRCEYYWKRYYEISCNLLAGYA